MRGTRAWLAAEAAGSGRRRVRGARPLAPRRAMCAVGAANGLRVRSSGSKDSGVRLVLFDDNHSIALKLPDKPGDEPPVVSLATLHVSIRSSSTGTLCA